MIEPLSAIAAAVSLGQASIEAARAIRKRLQKAKLGKDDMGEIREALQGLESGLLESQDTILDLKASVLELKEEKLRLVAENSELTQQLSAKESDSQKYKRVQIGKSWVVVEEGTEEPHYCPTCYGKSEDLIPIQPLPPGFRHELTHLCATCDTLFNLDG